MRMAMAAAVVAAVMMMAGCSQPAASDNAAAPEVQANTAATPYVATVAALPEGQRRGVLFRAITDAGRDCQSIVDSRREADVQGRATWSARCADGAVWLVALGDDGVAQVSQAKPLR